MARNSVTKNILGKILDALKSHPEGLTIYEIRDAIQYPGVQQHLDRRVRDLRKKHNIPIKPGGKYVYEGERSEPPPDSGAINARLRAAVLNSAHSRCQMCGRTVAEDSIKLVPDHKVPHNWGGPTILENLWAICTLCNGGKRDFFSSFADEEMQKMVRLDSVHARLGEMLRMHEGKPIPSWGLEFVANLNDFQEDWHRRLRELRTIGIDYSYKRTRLPTGKVETAYTLTKWPDHPPDYNAIVKVQEHKKKAD